jgi:Sensors of blue-light using FAD
MRIKQLVYASRQAVEFDGLRLVSLLYTARDRNAAQGITGVLLYSNGMFVQCLEGPPENVDAIYAKICLDHRHKELVVLQSIDTDERHFQTWMMGCAKVSDYQALELMRSEWQSVSDAMDRPGWLSPGFVLMKTMWDIYKDFGELNLDALEA